MCCSARGSRSATEIATAGTHFGDPSKSQHKPRSRVLHGLGFLTLCSRQSTCPLQKESRVRLIVPRGNALCPSPSTEHNMNDSTNTNTIIGGDTMYIGTEEPEFV